MAQLKILRHIFLRHRWQLILTYFLFSLEMLGALATPFFIAEAVKGLINNNYTAIFILCSVRLAWMLISVLRQRFDTRTYTSIYTSIVTKFLSKRHLGKDVSKLAAHSTLAREFVDFLEHDLVYVLEAGYNIVGSLVFLYFYHKTLVVVCLAVLLPIIFISYNYGKKMRFLNQKKNDELENQVNIIASNNTLAIRRHYDKLRFWQIKISDKQAINFGIMEIFAIAITAAALLILKNTNSAALHTGEEIGVLLYIKNYVLGLDTIPYVGDRLSNLQDITKRIELETEDNDNYKPDLRVVNE